VTCDIRGCLLFEIGDSLWVYFFVVRGYSGITVTSYSGILLLEGRPFDRLSSREDRGASLSRMFPSVWERRFADILLVY